MGLSTLAVIFVGLAGGHHGKVEKQITTLVHELAIESHPLAPAALRSVTHHDATTRDLVRDLHSEAVVAFEITTQGALRVVIYDRDGKLASFSESPLDHETLSAEDLGVLRDNLSSDLESLTGHRLVVVHPAPPAQRPVAEPKSDAAPAEETDDSAVSASDIEAMMGQPATDAEATAVELASIDPALHIGVAVGVGVATRKFMPGPSALSGYSSSPVGAVRLDVELKPSATTRLQLSTERTLGMTTPSEQGDASTTVSRWEATGGYALARGYLVPTVGLGRRAFSIASMDQSRAPDHVYDYLVLGAATHVQLGKRIALRGIAAFEPVVAGAEPTEMALGEASRWAVDAGAGVDVQLGHAYLRAAADYQRFTWSWDKAGARGAGGATDTYVSGSLSIGAEY